MLLRLENLFTQTFICHTRKYRRRNRLGFFQFVCIVTSSLKLAFNSLPDNSKIRPLVNVFVTHTRFMYLFIEKKSCTPISESCSICEEFIVKWQKLFSISTLTYKCGAAVSQFDNSIIISSRAFVCLFYGLELFAGTSRNIRVEGREKYWSMKAGSCYFEKKNS